MGFIREPKGVDLFINSGTLTDKDRLEISKFISEYKQKNQGTKSAKKRTVLKDTKEL